MDKNVLKKYAIWARRELIVRVSQRATYYGVMESGYGDVSAESINGRVLSASEKKQRQALIAQIQKKGYEEVIEEVAYTWFNRFLALRFMEVNGYLPSRVKIFTDSDNCFKPQILTEAINIEIDGLDMEKVYAYKDANQTEELYRYLLVVQCNALNAVLPGLFQKIEDYTELLLPDKLLLEGSVIERMIVLIPEEDWKDAVQIIGWMYQYYNSEKKDEVFAALKKNVKITKENIPAATQLFTPDWIVRYMVENSLGRLWLEGHPNEELKSNWKYYLEEAEQEPEVEAELVKIRAEYAQLTPEDIRCIDPCQGSGHILVYMFDVLMQIYESYGYTTQEAVVNIVKNNIYGLDIDERAAQLSYFAVMMKACQYDKRFLKRKDEEGKPKVPQPRVYAIQESNDVDSHVLEYFCNGNTELKEAMQIIMEEMHDAKEYGSIITVTKQNWDAIYARFEEIKEDISIYKEGALELLSLVQVAQALTQKYHVVVTNPPYMGFNNMGMKLSSYIKNSYPKSKSDISTIFMEKCMDIAALNGVVAMINIPVWMFLSSYEELREQFIINKRIINLLHLGRGVFGADFGTTAFVIGNSYIKGYLGKYRKLYKKQGTVDENKKKIEMFMNGTGEYVNSQDKFLDVPGYCIAYEAGGNLLDAFVKGKRFNEFSDPKQGLATADNSRFLRLWFEVDLNNVSFICTSHDEAMVNGKKWFPYNKGGGYKKWFGNNEYLINWKEDGRELYNFKNSVIRSPQFYFRECLSWCKVTISGFSMRYIPQGFLFDVAGCSLFLDKEQMKYVLGYANSVVNSKILSIISPTVNYEVGHIASLPLLHTNCITENVIKNIVEECINIAEEDWDAFEISWNFMKHPLISIIQKNRDIFYDVNNIDFSMSYVMWEKECINRFNRLKVNEEELNRIFIDIYGLQDELSPEVENKDVTVRKADLQRDIKSLISYAVGCMFGRYSLYVPGIVYAGGEWPPEEKAVGVREKYFPDADPDIYSWTDAYGTYMPDMDNIIPISDDEYFENDILEKFIEFIRIVYGEESLDTNLKFIADALGGKGQPREVIRNYFINDFYNDHCKIYQKRPIYWLFDSGKKNGFKCLIYMHRYQPDTIARIRTDYVHEQQSRYRTAMADLEHRIANAGTSELVKLNKLLKKIQEQVDELHTYEEKIHHLADQMIAIDLDDGVKHNYEIFKDVLAKIK